MKKQTITEHGEKIIDLGFVRWIELHDITKTDDGLSAREIWVADSGEHVITKIVLLSDDRDNLVVRVVPDPEEF